MYQYNETTSSSLRSVVSLILVSDHACKRNHVIDVKARQEEANRSAEVVKALVETWGFKVTVGTGCINVRPC